MVASVFRETAPHLVREPCARAAGEVGGLCRSAGELLEEAEADAPAYLDFPEGHRRRLRASNVQERLNGEIKRRSRVARVFPSVGSLVRLMGAALAERDEDWAARRRFKDSSIRRAFEKRRPEGPCGDPDAIAEKALAIMGIAKDKNVEIGKRAA